MGRRIIKGGNIQEPGLSCGLGSIASAVESNLTAGTLSKISTPLNCPVSSLQRTGPCCRGSPFGHQAPACGGIQTRDHGIAQESLDNHDKRLFDNHILVRHWEVWPISPNKIAFQIDPWSLAIPGGQCACPRLHDDNKRDIPP